MKYMLPQTMKNVQYYELSIANILCRTRISNGWTKIPDYSDFWSVRDGI